VLRLLFRRLFLNYLEQAFDAGELQFFSSLEPLRTRHAFLRHIAPTRKINWKVYAKPPFGGPEQVLKYVARYIRRFLLHVLPEGFQRIRYYGFLANRYRAEKLALCRQLLQIPPPAPNLEVKKDYRDRYEEITGVSLKSCPQCHHGTMIVIERFECAPCRAPRMDTS